MPLEFIKLRISIVEDVHDKIKNMLLKFNNICDNFKNDICDNFKELSVLMETSFVMKLDAQRNAITEQCKYYDDQFKFWKYVYTNYGKKYMHRSHMLVQCADDMLMGLRGIEDQLRSIMEDLVDSIEIHKSKDCKIFSKKEEEELNILVNGIKPLIDEVMISSVRIDVIVGRTSR